MTGTVQELKNQLNALEHNLFLHVENFDNHMNECSCDDSFTYDFSNTIEKNEIQLYCLNCGGWIDCTLDVEV